MKAKMFRALLPLAIVFTMVSCSSDSSEGSSTDKQIVTTYNYNDTELKLVTLINDYRASIGLNQLEVINHISYKSQEHNIYMIDKNVVNHDYFQQRSNNLVEVLGAEKVESITLNPDQNPVFDEFLSNNLFKLIGSDSVHKLVSLKENFAPLLTKIFSLVLSLHTL